MEVGSVYKVHIIDEDNIGNGICKIDNMVVFVKGALKEDYLEIKIKNIKKNYAEATINKLLNPSNNRIIPKCKYYKECGGCTFLHTTYKHEKEIKIKYLEKLFDRKIELIDSILENNYRNKVTLHVNKGILGLYNDNTHNICEIDHCDLLDPKINDIIPQIKKYDLSCIKEIMIRCINNKIMISVTSSKEDINIVNIKCDSLYINNKLIKGEEYLIDEVEGYKFSIYPEAFYQVNKQGMINLYNEALKMITSSNSLLDLYCGTGTIGIWLNSKFNEIKGIEINKSAIKNANINKELNNIENISFICSDASNAKGNFDYIVVDPPRNGLSKDVIEYLNYSQTDKIIYISCNPNTLKRDINLLNNFELKDIKAIDMFPRTKHCESVCLLERR